MVKTDGPAVSILIVEDDSQVRDLMQKYLRQMGYMVESCGDAPPALALVRANPLQFALLITDLQLPAMPGIDMALLMVKLNPDLLVLLCSGSPFELESLPPSLRNQFGTLLKPFAPKMLTSALDTLLHRGSHAR